jgi:dipeptidyl aminopeptidase/acylaminoacyl peptidase
MHDDLIDAVEWAVGQGIARRDKVAIMGGSYGGYAALVGLTFTPEVFACAVDIVGPSNLVTLLQNPPPYWAPFMPVLKYRLFDVSTQAGREELEKRSPLFYIDRICRPLLIAQGQHDPRVKRAESDQIVAAMNAKSIPVTYLLFENEGHGFERPENRFAFYAIAEAFLAEQLGGQCEPFGDALEGASLNVPSGSAHVPGLEHALKQRESVVPS